MKNKFTQKYLIAIEIIGIIFILCSQFALAEDTTDPVLNFVDPTPDDESSQSIGIVEINVSIQEENLNNINYNWDDTNYSMYDDTLVLMYNFDNVASLGEDSSTVTDLSGNENNGNVVSAIWSSSGKYNGAFQFDGEDDYIDLGTISSGNPLMLANQEFTISAWIHPQEGDQYQRLVDKSTGNGGDNGYAIYVYNDGSIKLAVHDQGELRVYPEDQGIDIHDGWHHLTAIATDSYFAIYVDGINITTHTSMSGSPTLPPDFETNFKIGNWNDDAGTRYWKGFIDELRIYNRALTEEEIYQHYISNLQKIDQTHWQLTLNQAKNTNEELDIGTYTYQTFAEDQNNNLASTEKRTIHITGPSPPVPEASTIILFTLGSLIILGLIFYKRRHNN